MSSLKDIAGVILTAAVSSLVTARNLRESARIFKLKLARIKAAFSSK